MTYNIVRSLIVAFNRKKEGEQGTVNPTRDHAVKAGNIDGTK